MAKSHEKFKTFGGVFDEFTIWNLQKIASEGHFIGLKSPLSIGKESNVFTAETDNGGLVAVKIYRLETCDFNKMYSYIKYDPRFTGLLKKRRKVIFTWAQREYRNLLRAHEAGVVAPLPITVRNNVLVEEFIGGDSPAPRLSRSRPKNVMAFFTQLVKEIKLLYKNGLTHGDLSEYNVLNYNEKPVLIDFSQATITESPRFEELFQRDVGQVCKFFSRLGIEADNQKTIKRITSGRAL